MKNLLKDKKEFLAILFAIIFLTISFIICIYVTVRDHNTKSQKRYEESCIINYVKRPFKVCTYKEVK